VALVSNDGDSHFCVVGEASLLSSFSRFHRDLEAISHLLELFTLAHVGGLKTWAQGVNVEEGIFAVLDFGHRLFIKSLMSLVASSGKVHPRLLLLNLNALEFSIEELSSISGVLDLARFGLSVEASELFFFEFGCCGGGETVGFGWYETLNVLGVDSGARGLGEGAAVQVFRLDLGHVPCIVRNVLRFDVGVGATEPVLALLGVVSDEELFIAFILGRGPGVKLALSELRLAH